MALIVATQIASTWAMVGLIWFVQIVHYPMFDGVGESDFSSYESRHQRLTTWVVAPLMLAEMTTAVLLLVQRPASAPTWAVGTAGALLLLIWLSTAIVQAPTHAALNAGYDAGVHRKLVMSNWLRTIAWTIRGLLVLTLIDVAQ